MSNMYEFADTWNPLCGECIHKCNYCYVDKMKERFPVLNKKYSGKHRLDFGKSGMQKNLSSGKLWFVESMSDLFAKNVPSELIIKIFEYCHKFPNNEYFFQSKNPKRFEEFTLYFPEKTILCTTIETNRNYNFLHSRYCPTTLERMLDIHRSFITHAKEHITIEPIMDFDLGEMITMMQVINPIQINIGADSGNNHLPEPPKEKILKLITELKKFTTVHQKDNLRRLLK